MLLTSNLPNVCCTTPGCCKAEEVESVKWVSIKDLPQLLRDGPVCPDSVVAVERWLDKYVLPKKPTPNPFDVDPFKKKVAETTPDSST